MCGVSGWPNGCVTEDGFLKDSPLPLSSQEQTLSVLWGRAGDMTFHILSGTLHHHAGPRKAMRCKKKKKN